jgi:hypothetical protein
MSRIGKIPQKYGFAVLALIRANLRIINMTVIAAIS